MMFENDLQSTPGWRNQFVAHLPLVIVAAGVLALFVALHVAAVGVIMLALGHVVVGLLLFVLRRHRSGDTSESPTP